MLSPLMPISGHGRFSKTDSKSVKMTWGEKHKQHVHAAKVPRAITFLGDSLISNFWRRPELLTFDGYSVHNFGIGGDRIENVLFRVLNGAVTMHSMIVVLHIGINNVLRDDSPNAIVDGIDAICKEIFKISHSCTILVGTILPAKCNFKKRAVLSNCNSNLRQWAKSFTQVMLVDHDKFNWHKADGVKLSRSLYWSGDFIHLSKVEGLNQLDRSYQSSI